jgi:hypothetical protein
MRAAPVALLAWACAIRPALAEEPTTADPAVLLVEHADALYQDQRYREALDEYQKVDAQRRSPALIYRLARTHQRLGNAREALAGYQRFLTASTDPPEALRADAERQIERLRLLLPATPEAEPAVPQVPPSPLRRPTRSGLLPAGMALTVSGYLPALITGIATFAAGWPKGVTLPLLLPVLGPVISGIVALEGYQPPISVTWGLPWIFVDGGVQVVGLALLIAAAVKRDVAPRARVQIAPWSTRGASGVVAVGQF